jgi:shikimate dehydrogenase
MTASTPSGVSARTLVAGVAGRPVRHSLSPVIHNAWLRGAGLDGVYVAFEPGEGGFHAFAEGLRGGVLLGVNVTAPFKTQALALADSASLRARAAGSANVLVFDPSGAIRADNTDGVGLLAALEEQAPAYAAAAGPAVILGAGGAARGAAAALLEAGAPVIRLVARSLDRAGTLATELAGPVEIFSPGDAAAAFDGAAVVINATPPRSGDKESAIWPLAALRRGAVVMDMVYRPLSTPLLAAAAARDLTVVDGLAMLIHQAVPSFQAFFGRPPPPLDIRAVVLAALGAETPTESVHR